MHGSLSPYLNALFFKAFGVCFDTLIFANFILLAVSLALLYAIGRKLAGRWVATATCALVVALLGFSRLGDMGNFNFITPYSHAATHGLLLSLSAILCLSFHLERPSNVRIAAAGALLGLTFLTKVEIFVAAAAACYAAVCLRRPSLERRRSLFPELTLLTCALASPVAAAALLLAPRLGLNGAARGVLGPAFYALRMGVNPNPFYLWCAGFDNPGLRLAQAFGAFAKTAGFLSALAIADIWLSRRKAGAAASWALAATTAGGLLIGLQLWPGLFHEAALGMSFLALVVVIDDLRLARFARTKEANAHAKMSFLFSAFALGLLAKIILNTRIYQYGFVLSFPAVALVAFVLLDRIPLRLAAGGASGGHFAAAMGACLVIWAGSVVRMTARVVGEATVAIGSGHDRFYDVSSARSTVEAFALIEARVPPGATLAVIPEGLMLNYLTKRRNSVPYGALLPVEVELFGEPAILAAFQRTPPDFVMLIHSDTSGLGARYFGRDYAQALAAWLQEAYEPSAGIGAEPFASENFGMRLLRRRKK
ncbi:MAG: glycosyltransferase family 39 protein [Elusimicrobiota bacterium]